MNALANITRAQLRAVCADAPDKTIDRYLPVLSDACGEFYIDKPARVAAFLAQIAHESGQLRWVREIWGPTAAQLRYEGRRDLGNVEPGDGRRFLGRGLIQITGRSNYVACSRALYGDPRVLLGQPELLESPDGAARSAAWFWQIKGLNALADAGQFELITRRINGGTNGLAERIVFWRRAQAARIQGSEIAKSTAG